MGLGEQVSIEVLRHLTQDEVRRITAEIASTPAVDSAQMLIVFKEFEALTSEGRLFAKGGADRARQLVESAFGQESAEELLAPVFDPEPLPIDPSILEDAEPQQLAMFLKNEHPQTIAVVLANVSPEHGGELLKALPEEVQTQAALRMAALERVSQEIFQKVTEVVGGRLRTIRQNTRTNGARSLATLLNTVDADLAEAILGRVEEQNRRIADSVRSLFFVFEDILKVEKDGMKALVSTLDRDVLAMALKGTKPNIRTHFTQCMSHRGAEMLLEDMEAMGPVRLRDVKNAQQAVIKAVRHLQQAGTIILGRDDKEDYVV